MLLHSQAFLSDLFQYCLVRMLQFKGNYRVNYRHFASDQFWHLRLVGEYRFGVFHNKTVDFHLQKSRLQLENVFEKLFINKGPSFQSSSSVDGQPKRIRKKVCVIREVKRNGCNRKTTENNNIWNEVSKNHNNSNKQQTIFRFIFSKVQARCLSVYQWIVNNK